MQRTIFKLNSKTVKTYDGNVQLSYQDALESGQLITISDSQVVAWLDELNGTTCRELDTRYKQLRSEHKYRQANELAFLEELVQVEYSSNKHFVSEFILNGNEYVWFINKGSAVVTYIRKGVSDCLYERMNNGRDMQVKFIPAKLNAYLGLAMSSSREVITQPKHVVVVNDNITEFEATYTRVTVDAIEDVTEIVRMESSDGNGCIDYRLLQAWSDELGYGGKLSSGVSVRNAFIKGMVFPVDLQKFFSKHNVKTITDVYGKVHDTKDVDMIIPTSMFKLWQSYDSYDEYEMNCKKNGYTFRVCKESHEVKASRTNYQQTTDLEMTDEQIQRMIAPSVQHLKDVAGGDWLSTVLYLNGQSLTDSVRLTGMEQAIMVAPELIHDSYIVNLVKMSTRRRREQMCLGKYNVKTNYQIISSDLYHFLGAACSVPNNGLLKAGEVYSHWHAERGYQEAIAVRSPMISKENLARVKIADSSELRDFYKYMPEIVVLNDFDLTCETLAGADKDGDTVQLMVDEVILEAQKPVLPVKCQAVKGEKVVCDTTKPLIAASILACDESKYSIGGCINKITAMFSKRSEFDKDSAEYEELNKRILLGLMVSQSYIDFKKLGMVVMDMPRSWYNLNACETDFERRICADKKPYFLAKYKGSKTVGNGKPYDETMELIHTRSIARWGISGKELLSLPKEQLSQEQVEFINYYANVCEVFLNDNSTQHRLCTATEDAIGRLNYSDNIINCKHLFKDERVITDARVTKQVRELYNKHIDEMKRVHDNDDDYDRILYTNEFFTELSELHEDIRVVYNSVVDVIYNTKSMLLFELFGDMVIENLARKHNYEIHIPVPDENGDCEYMSKRFRIEIRKLKSEDDYLC